MIMDARIAKLALVALLTGLMVVGCGEPEVITVSATDADEAEAKAATVTPEFRIHGLQQLPQGLLLDELGLSVAEIRLEPLRGSHGVAYTTSRPLDLRFDIENGETRHQGQTVQIPETGRFLVSVRLEPAELDPQIGGEEADFQRGSLSLFGYVRSDFSASVDDEDGSQGDEDDENDGNPLPLPVEPIGDDPMWTPFAYASQRVVFYTFSDVELVGGEQSLTFHFDLNDWASTAVTPIVDAVEKTSDDGVVDVSEKVDSPTSGPEALLESGSVSTDVE